MSESDMWNMPVDPQSSPTSHEEDVHDSKDIPLQFRALYHQSSPSNGVVSASKLSTILTNAQIPTDAAASILSAATNGPEGTEISESAFYNALRDAVDLQRHEAPESSSSADHPLLLHSSEGNAEFLSEEILEFDPISPGDIQVTLMDHKEGSFLFRHAVYTVFGQHNGKQFRVIRRYRDFAWLLEQLVRKYPFRVLPLLPPKRLTMDGRYLTGDENAFLQRRRRGLQRFINLLVKHPVVRTDRLISTFLFVATQFEGAKKAVKGIWNGDELEGKHVSPLFISRWDQNKETKRWFAMKAAVDELLAQTTSACFALERSITRRLSEAADYDVLSRNMYALSRSLVDAYPTNNSEIPAIQSSIEAAGTFADDSRTSSSGLATSLSTGPLEELKKYREMLLAVRELFLRYGQLGGNTIPALQTRIKNTRAKLADKATKPETQPEELDKLQAQISDAHEQIKRQTERDWAIKLVLGQELEMIQTMQFQISAFLRSLVGTLNDDATSRTHLASKLLDAAGAAPLHN